MIHHLLSELSSIFARIEARMYRSAHAAGTSTLYQLRYDEAGKPYGDTAEGFARWMVEQEIRQELEEGRRRRGPESPDRRN